VGTIRGRGWLYDIHQIDRFPRVQDFASSARFVQCSQASGGKRSGPSGKNIGNAPLTGAFAEAATLCLRHNLQGQKLLSRPAKKHGKGKALSIPAPQLGRAVYDRLTRNTAFAMDLFLQSEGSRAGEPGAALDSTGMRLHRARRRSDSAAALNAKAGLGPVSRRPRG
jgi:hypothetical protein